MAGFIDGVNRLFLLEYRDGSMHCDAHKEELGLIEALVRRMMVADHSVESKLQIRVAVNEALKHMDECEQCSGTGRTRGKRGRAGVCAGCGGTGEAS